MVARRRMPTPFTPPPPLPLDATDKHLIAHYGELRQIARRLMLSEQAGHSLSATDLAHEAWMRLIGTTSVQALAPEELRRRAAAVMRHMLVDRARARAVKRRHGAALKLQLDALDLMATGKFDDLLAVDEAIEQLQLRDAALAELVRLRFFTGLSIEETAQVLDKSPRTVNRDWNYARALLAQFLTA